MRRSDRPPSESERPVVTIVMRTLPHYRVPMYEAARRILDENGVELELLYTANRDLQGRGMEGTAPAWAEPMHQHRASVLGREVLWHPVVRRLRRVDLVVVEQAARNLENYALMALRRIGYPPLAMWGHGKNIMPEDRSWLGELVKRRTARGFDWFFGYTAVSAATMAAVGFPADRVVVLDNASDTSPLRDAIAHQRRRPREERLDELGLPDGQLALVLGSLYVGKRIERLLEAGVAIRRTVPDFGLLIVGDGPDRERLEALAEPHPWVTFLGRRMGPELAQVASVCRLTLVSKLAGLNVVDSLAMGLPVVAVGGDGEGHGPEIAYVRSGENGVLLPRGASSDDFVNAVSSLIVDDDRLAALSDEAARSTEHLTSAGAGERLATAILTALGRDTQPATATSPGSQTARSQTARSQTARSETARSKAGA